MFLQFINEASGAWPYRGLTESLDNDSSNTINSDENLKNKEYIYVQKDNQLLKFFVKTEHMNITDTLEQYLNNSSLYNFEVLSEKDIKDKFPLKLVRSVGKYKLEGNLLKTNNYLVPPVTELTNILNEKYKENNSFVTFSSKDLHKLNLIKEAFRLDERIFELQLIENLLSSFEVELKGIYDISEKELETYIDNITKLIGFDENKTTLSKLRWILVSASHNEEYITGLGIEDKFDKTINKGNQKVK